MRDEQGIRTPGQSLAGRVLNVGFDQLVRRGLHGVWLRGELPPSEFVWAANHHSWWDGFLASAVLQRLGRPASLLMEGANLGSYGFLRRAGVVSAQRPREALQALCSGRTLVIFPETELRAPGELGTLAPGAEWFARRACVPLVAVAVRVSNRGHQYPEAYLDVGPAVGLGGLADQLGHQLRALDRELTDSDPRASLDGFDCVVPGRHSWDERIARWSRWRR